MPRVLLTIVAALGLAATQAQTTVSITFTSDPTGAILSIAPLGDNPEQIGPTPVSVDLLPGETYSLKVVAVEPYPDYDLYVPYTVMYLAPAQATEVSIWIERTTAAQQESQRNPPAAIRPFTEPINSTTPRNRSCCRVCSAGKACGNSCIARNKTCRQPPGCAC